MSDVLKSAMTWGQANYPNLPIARYCAFANSVAYLTSGASGGYGGPSIREHCVSWALAGDGENIPGGITIQIPDGRLPRAGQWEFERACQFAAPICFGPLPQIATRIAEQECCFDDDPDDLTELERRKK